MANIAEGFSRQSHRDFARFLDIARGSLSEVQSLLYATLDQTYITQTDFDHVFQQTCETASLVARLTSHLRKRTNPPSDSPDDGHQ
jgi:four helix bundle protein